MVDIKSQIDSFLQSRNDIMQSKKTISAYKETLEEFFYQYCFQKGLTIDNIQPKDVFAFTSWKQEKALERAKDGQAGIGIGRNMIGERIKAATMNRHFSAIKQFLDFVGKNDLSKRIKSIPRQKDFDIIEFSEIKKVFDLKNIYSYYQQKVKSPKDGSVEFYSIRLKLLFDFIFSTGLRINEVFNVKKEDLKLDRKVPVVEVVFAKGGKKRIVELSQVWLKEMQLFWDRYPLCKKSEYLFTDVAGNRLAYSTLGSYIKTVGKFIGVQRLSAHKLRHAYALLLYERDGDIMKLKDRLGHSKIETTIVYLSKIKNKKDFVQSPLDTLEVEA